MNVWIILIPAFMLVGAWLFFYNNKRGALMRQFAAANALVLPKKGYTALEGELDQRFALPGPYVRGFSRIRDVIDLPLGQLFRVTELLDLSRYGNAQSTHTGRIALYIPYSIDCDLFLLVSKKGSFRRLIPEYPVPTNNMPGIDKVRQFFQDHPPPHELSLTIKEDYLIAYLVPIRIGSESLSDLSYLSEMAKSLPH